MKFTRSAGILLHPTSFPGPDGIGDLGPEAYNWIDFLKKSGCSLWQTLPLGPTGYGDSPYQCFSAFAGNHYLVSPTLLLDQGLLSTSDFSDRPSFSADRIDYGAAIQWKTKLLDRAFEHFKQEKTRFAEDFWHFCEENKFWLNDYALFMALKEAKNGTCWLQWGSEYRNSKTEASQKFAEENPELIEKHMFRQFLFFRQWSNLKRYANENGVSIIGDIPIFVSLDSSDLWSNPDLFFLDEQGNPTVVAGVPPDYFSPTGQLWGNPHYNWAKHQETDFSWWIDRLRNTLRLCDFVRLDHFRGFSGYWEVPAGNETAQNGRWVKGPGAPFLQAIKNAFGDLPLIAEDLGEISQDVIDLRDEFDLPGMKILQFAFSDEANNAFLPTNYIPNCVAYTGTHDNATSMGWYHEANDKEKDFARKFFASNGSDFAWDMIHAIWHSVAVFSIAPLQDFLSLGNDARMNYPSRAMGNWGYRYRSNDLTPDLAFRILEMNQIDNRIPEISSKEPYRANITYQLP